MFYDAGQAAEALARTERQRDPIRELEGDVAAFMLGRMAGRALAGWRKKRALDPAWRPVDDSHWPTDQS